MPPSSRSAKVYAHSFQIVARCVMLYPGGCDPFRLNAGRHQGATPIRNLLPGIAWKWVSGNTFNILPDLYRQNCVR